MQTFEVVMIGNQAVGKTSMLSALSRELDAYNLARRVQLSPTTEEVKTLDAQWSELLRQVEAKKPFRTLDAGIDATFNDFTVHEFEFTVDGEKEAQVLFTDTKGGLTGELDQRLVDRVNGAFGVFCVVDASILMQCPASTNNQWNCPNRIKTILDKVYNDGDDKQPRFVAFILTKCERWMATEEGRRDLAATFHKHYDNIVDLLHKAPHPPNIHLLAIQTMTCVTFFKLGDNGLPMYRVLPAKELATEDCAYPLVILLRNIIEARVAGRGFWEWVMQAIGWMPDLKDYLAHIGAHVRQPKLHEEL